MDAALIALWLAFASHVSGLPIPLSAPAPIVSIVSSLPNGWEGATDRDTGHVELLDQPKISPAYKGCVLAHELTHTLQVWNGLSHPASCPDDVEPLAYRTSAICFSQSGMRDQERWAWEQVRRRGCH